MVNLFGLLEFSELICAWIHVVNEVLQKKLKILS